MSGNEWVKETIKLGNGLAILDEKFEIAILSPEKERLFLMCQQSATWGTAFQRMRELITRFDEVSPADPFYIKAVALKNNLLSDLKFVEVKNIFSTTRTACEMIRTKKSAILPNIWPYFLDEVQKRGEQIEKITDLSLDKIKQFLPWILAGGAILIVLNAVSLVPKK